MSTFLQQLTSPPALTFRTLQPTPSTIQYTVSTRPVPTTVLAFLGHYIRILVRVVVGLSTVLLAWTKWRITVQQSTFALQWIVGSAREAQLLKLAEACSWRYLAPTALVVLFLVVRRGYKEESLTLLRGLGVQTSTTSSTYLQTPTTRFIPTTCIQDIFIHEAFKGFEVKFYLAIVVQEEESVVVVFPSLLPRRAMLEQVWRGAKKCLWESSIYTKEKQKEKVEPEY
ncbi:GPI-GlcNAc transferase complex, PIG-H component-domain-containing protein [Pyrenochaeta sp. MPI-SDFR-AT-0127]|nr:GPI-GlcNAc transferase complex, PIG-H component-domain-containing protein [Pyrenochaeta sp. MPI-SDFR-AT-0127]